MVSKPYRHHTQTQYWNVHLCLFFCYFTTQDTYGIQAISSSYADSILKCSFMSVFLLFYYPGHLWYPSHIVIIRRLDTEMFIQTPGQRKYAAILQLGWETISFCCKRNSHIKQNRYFKYYILDNAIVILKVNLKHISLFFILNSMHDHNCKQDRLYNFDAWLLVQFYFKLVSSRIFKNIALILGNTVTFYNVFALFYYKAKVINFCVWRQRAPRFEHKFSLNKQKIFVFFPAISRNSNYIHTGKSKRSG